jgi:hypothetical protein
VALSAGQEIIVTETTATRPDELEKARKTIQQQNKMLGQMLLEKHEPIAIAGTESLPSPRTAGITKPSIRQSRMRQGRFARAPADTWTGSISSIPSSSTSLPKRLTTSTRSIGS